MPDASPQIREARLEDYAEIARLQSRNGLISRPYKEWSALWTENPAFLQAGGSWPIGWVLESRDEILGFIGNLPLAYSFRGHELRAATPYSWAVDLRYRAYSMGLLLRFVGQKELDLVVCATVNAAAERVYRACQFQRVPAGAWDTSAFWITGYRGFARSALRAASIPMPELLAYPRSATLFLRDAVSRGFQETSPGCTLELCPQFDVRFDDFWQQLRMENPDLLLADRNRKTLQWHFRSALAQGNAWILAASHNGRLVAYTVFDRQDSAQLALKRLRVADFQALRGFENTLRPALTAKPGGLGAVIF